MDHLRIATALGHNRDVFRGMLHGIEQEQYLWRPAPDKWCLLEVICHLYDEEREDFRARVQHVLTDPSQPMPPIDPQGWVSARNYIQHNFHEVLHAFLAERADSVSYINSLEAPEWSNTYIHPKLGPLSAGMFLHNWLAHDYHHIRQVNDLKYRYFLSQSRYPLTYAGKWE